MPQQPRNSGYKTWRDLVELIHPEEEKKTRKQINLLWQKRLKNTKLEELLTTQPNPRQTICALTYSSACKSYGNLDVCNDVVESQFSDIKIATIYRQSIIQVQWLMAPLIMVKWSSCRDLLKILNKLTLAAQQACNIAALTVRKINSPSRLLARLSKLRNSSYILSLLKVYTIKFDLKSWWYFGSKLSSSLLDWIRSSANLS